jgi:two-component system, LytTR family, response regulator
MIRALIADDEELSRRALSQLLRRHPDVEVVAECRDGAEAREALEKFKPDVAFLDIRMPLETGLDVATARDRAHETLIVFVTAFDKFALSAFDADAMDYLTKPLTEPRFDETLSRVRERVRVRRAAEQPGGSTSTEPRYAPHLVARTATTDIIIPLETIDYIQADDVYAAVFSRGKRLLIRQPLDALEDVLDPHAFARVHRSYIVRLDRVVAVNRGDGTSAEVVLSTGIVLPVSRRRRTRLTDWFRQRND